MRPLDRLLFAAFLLSTACTRSRDRGQEPAAQRPEATTAALGQAPVAVAQESTWYQGEDVRDLTGDGVPDTLTLTATGTRIDSLHIFFDIKSGGRRLYHATWLSTWYFEYEEPIESLAGGVKRTRVMQHFREFFGPRSSSVVDTMGAGRHWDPHGDEEDLRSTIAFDLRYQAAVDSLTKAGMKADSAESLAGKRAAAAPVDTQLVLRVWQDLVTRRPPTFSFFSGGEYTRTIAWSPVLERFIVIRSCC